MIEKLCRDNGSDFAVCALEPVIYLDIFPNLSIKSPKVNLSFYHLNEPEYRVLLRLDFHPNAKVHAYWAERFSDRFDREYQLR